MGSGAGRDEGVRGPRGTVTTTAAYFKDVDHVFTCSQFLTDVYRTGSGSAARLLSRRLTGRRSWHLRLPRVRDVVDPSLHKGLQLFARLADMLGSRRPDIPILVVQSGQSGGSLNNIPGVEFRNYPQIMAAPAVDRPADYFALTRILLVPSVWEEPFGRVAAEAMINGIPPLVGNRGALPNVVGGDVGRYGGGGFVLPIPAWMTRQTIRLPASTRFSRGMTLSARCGMTLRCTTGSPRERARLRTSAMAKMCRARPISISSHR